MTKEQEDFLCEMAGMAVALLEEIRNSLADMACAVPCSCDAGDLSDDLAAIRAAVAPRAAKP